jgi:predicted dehydrogenase
LIKSGAIGKVHMVRMADHRNNAEGAWVYPIPPDASTETIDWDRFIGSSPKRAFDPKIFFRWRCWWEYSGGVATDLYVHLLTWLHEVMDISAPKAVVSQGGIYKWNDGRSVPDIMNSIFEYDGFIADMYVNLASGFGARGIFLMGTEGTLVSDRGKFTLYPERILPDIQSYGTLGWPKAMRAAYFESNGWTAEGRPKTPLPEAKKPEEITIPRGPSHYELFITSVRENKPSRETATEGHYAAGAAHIANLAYRKGRRVSWDYKTGKVKES